MTERQLQDEANRLAAELGSTGPWTPPTTRVGIGTMVAHPDFPMQDRAAADGDIVVLDMTPTIDGWLGDHCTSAVLGEDDESADVVAGCRWVQQQLIAAVVPGMPAAELHALGLRLAAERDLRLLDLLDNFGHSIGREFAAEGFIDPTNSTPMYGAWTIEPHLGRLGRGAKFEDIVWLPAGGVPTVV
jgi:Xaa-Pro aminopeptidase